MGFKETCFPIFGIGICLINCLAANIVLTENGPVSFESSIKTSLDNIQTQLSTFQGGACPSTRDLQDSLKLVHQSLSSCYESVTAETRLRALAASKTEGLSRLQDAHARLNYLRGELHESKVRELQLKEDIRIETAALNSFCAGKYGDSLVAEGAGGDYAKKVDIKMNKIGGDVIALKETDERHSQDIEELKTKTDRLEANDRMQSKQLQVLTAEQELLMQENNRQNANVDRLVKEAERHARDNEEKYQEIRRLQNDTLTLIDVDAKQNQMIKKTDASLLGMGTPSVDVGKIKEDIERIESSHETQNKIMDEIKVQIVELKNTSSVLEKDLTKFTKKVEVLKEKVAVQNDTIRFINKRNDIQQKPRSKFAAVSKPLNGHFYSYSRRLRVNMTLFQEECAKLKGYIVEINDEEEYNFIKEFVRTSGVIPHGYSYSDKDNIMIGRSDADEEGKWMYLHSKTPVTFTNWHPGEPNGKHRRNCVNLYAFHFHMHDTKCIDNKWHRRVICEIPV